MHFAGLDSQGLSEVENTLLHPLALQAYQSLCVEAQLAGFHVTLVSGFRSFERQLSIWNRKAKGELSLLDAHGNPIDAKTLSPESLLWTILNWSALPGCSRHHWGTDLDLVGQPLNATPVEAELVPAEFQLGGPFHEFHQWLDLRIHQQQAFGFVKPYVAGRGSIRPEPWHISLASVANAFAKQLNAQDLRALFAQTDIALRSQVELNLEAILAQTVVPYQDLYA